MTSDTRDLGQLLAEQNEQYARIKREIADYERQQQEEEREHAERFEEDEARLERERIDELLAFEQAERKNRWFRGIGYPTRTIVFLAMIGLWFVLAYAFRDPS